MKIEEYVDAVSSGNCSLYFHVNTAYVFSMQHCIVNVVNCGDDYYSDTNNPINVYNARYFSVSNIDVYATTSQYGGDYGPGSGTALNFSNRQLEQENLSKYGFAYQLGSAAQLLPPAFTRGDGQRPGGSIAVHCAPSIGTSANTHCVQTPPALRAPPS